MPNAPKIIEELIEIFERDIDNLKSAAYNETQLRSDFVNPFWKALGWDMTNEAGYAIPYRDVKQEFPLKVGLTTKAPDYCFTIAGKPKFFLETKKPSVDVKHEIHPAYQLRRYGWSGKLPLSILTDFEEMAVYDCRIRPKKNDKPSQARIKYYTFREYIDKWDEIESVFSRDAILKGSFDKYVESKKGKRGTSEVDTEFLKEIEKWREALARNIALRNPAIDIRGINFAVQRTIDRIIFLRMCEDRGIEDYSQLQNLCAGTGIYKKLVNVFRNADDKYNSGLFHFKKETGRASIQDTLTPNIRIDDKIIKEILARLYYPESPYEFSFMPAEILGNVYEQFLGKVIRLTKGHQAKVEEKPEVRKAGGVYYTPAYIVDYIVENTVGKLCGGKKPKDIAKLKILDPACGSGSFLLGAFQYLLDYHLKYYTDEMDKTGKVPKPPSQTGKGKKKRDRQAIYQGQDGGWYLTTTEKKRILLNNIYGVDIDSQAVEVTKLSLLLKVLENENKDTLHQQMFLIKERALPDLSDNVKCGNSLIASDFYTQSEQTLMFDDEEQYRINAFDWDVEFPDIMKGRNPGFDAVIGNPPYRRELDYKHLMDEIAKTKFGQKYRAPRMDLWYYFIHRSLELLKTGGQLSFIVNAYWVAATGSEKLIKTLREKAQIDEIFFFKKLRVFTNVSGQHMIIRITNNNDKNTTLIKLVEPTSEISAEPFVTGNSSVNEFMKAHDQLFTENKVDLEPPAGELLSKIGKWPILNLLGKVRQGIAENPSVINRKTNEKFGNIWEIGEGVFTIRPENVKKLNLSKTEKKLLRAYHDLCDLGRYQIASKPSFFIIYSTRYTCPDINRYPKIRDHLKRFKVIMNARRETQKGSNKWWHLHWPRDEEIWKSAKIMSIQMGKRPMFVPSLNPVYVPFSVNVFLPYQETREHIHYITGVLNSRLIFKWYQHYAKRRGVGLEINGNVLSKTPIRTIDFTDPADKARHDKMVKLVSNMLTLHKRIQESKTPHEREMIQRRIVATDRQIDNLVYELYDLTDEEVAVVEGS